MLNAIIRVNTTELKSFILLLNSMPAKHYKAICTNAQLFPVQHFSHYIYSHIIDVSISRIRSFNPEYLFCSTSLSTIAWNTSGIPTRQTQDFALVTAV